MLLACAFFVYSYCSPDIRMTVSEPMNADAEGFLQQVMVGVSTKFGLPLPRGIQRNVRTFAMENEALVTRLMQSYAMPMRISAAVEVKNGQTVVCYAGSASTPEGATATIDERLTFDFVLTRNISD